MELALTLAPDFERQLRRIPDNTRLVGAVPPVAILPSCAAVVHHGGTWSFGGSLRYGVPQLLISQAFDAPAKFQCLGRTGAGMPMKPSEVDGPGVRAALVRLLEDSSLRETPKPSGRRCSPCLPRTTWREPWNSWLPATVPV